MNKIVQAYHPPRCQKNQEKHIHNLLVLKWENRSLLYKKNNFLFDDQLKQHK
jgi:hypothetical protein